MSKSAHRIILLSFTTEFSRRFCSEFYCYCPELCSRGRKEISTPATSIRAAALKPLANPPRCAPQQSVCKVV
jgi:hypothetical protein